MNTRAPRNRTLTCSQDEIEVLSKELLWLDAPVKEKDIENRVIKQDIWVVSKFLPITFADLLILDMPYNLNKIYNSGVFRATADNSYVKWFADLMMIIQPALKLNASVYVCCDWRTSAIIYPILKEYFFIQNRITWARDKGRGAKRNWKNNSEDIWFATKSKNYVFNLEYVKLKRRVLAPYRNENGAPKDWKKGEDGNYRMTHPSNIWTDITVPFWSMPENTDHPTQKPEKLLAKMILASSNEGDMVFDPFLGSGTTTVVAKKLGRRFCGVEVNLEYCCWALKRLKQAEIDKSIQGYVDGVFWERNSLNAQSVKH